MEFHNKLQELRKSRGLTQEELAKELFVSRTAISKWESGKGYPAIDSLKCISKFFGISIDELLSSEELITAAKDENNSNLGNMTDFLVGAADVMSIILILLPLFPKDVEGNITAVTLFTYTNSYPVTAIICWILFMALIITGAVKLIMNYRKTEKGRGAVTAVSFVLSIVSVLFLTVTRLPYAVTVVFLLLVIKSVLVYRLPVRQNNH